MSSETSQKKQKISEEPVPNADFSMSSTEERLMLRFDDYKTRKRTSLVVDDDTLKMTTTWRKEKACLHCFKYFEPSYVYLDPPKINPYFILQRFKYSKFTPLLTIELHPDCMAKLIWIIATKQAYSITTLSIQMRSYVRDILLRMHKAALERTIRASVKSKPAL